MDASQIRYRNYRALIEQFRHRPENKGLPEYGTLKRFAEFTGVSPRYFPHINNGRKNIGAKTARSIEAAFGYPKGWLDTLHEGPIESASDAEREFVTTALRLYRESPVDVQAALVRYMMENRSR